MKDIYFKGYFPIQIYFILILFITYIILTFIIIIPIIISIIAIFIFLISFYNYYKYTKNFLKLTSTSIKIPGEYPKFGLFGSKPQLNNEYLYYYGEGSPTILLLGIKYDNIKYISRSKNQKNKYSLLCLSKDPTTFYNKKNKKTVCIELKSPLKPFNYQFFYRKPVYKIYISTPLADNFFSEVIKRIKN